MMSKDKGPYPPVILLACLLLQIGLHYGLPIMTIVERPWNWAGAALIVFGILIVIGPVTAFSRADTTIKPFQESSALVVEGMYRFTRNPMYLGMVTVLAGVAVLTGSVSPFVGPVLFVPLMNRRVIRFEEAMLEERFGDEYRNYKDRVRRWL